VSGAEIHYWVALGVMALGVVTFLSLTFITAPYGRHARAGWGPTIASRTGWIVMESPSVLLFATVFAMGPHRAELVPLVLLGLWQLHYLQRTLVFPALLRAPDKPMPASIVAMGVSFNLVNAWMNASWVSGFGTYASTWLRDPRFVAGAVLFLAGFAINVRADAELRRLRRPGDQGYKVPRGGLHELRTTRASSSSGAAGRWRPGPSPGSPSPCTRRRTSCRGRSRTTAGTAPRSPTTRRSAAPSSPGSSDLHADGWEALLELGGSVSTRSTAAALDWIEAGLLAPGIGIIAGESARSHAMHT
jgi:hypothetical protein